MSEKPEWSEAPQDATHRHSKSIMAHWYKMIDGVWHYHYARDVWKKSSGLTDITDYLEPRP